MSIPVMLLISSPERCCEVPVPDVPNDSDFVLASAMNSLTLFAGTAACTASTNG